VILLFGAKKLPDAARSLGKSMRIFKSELREMQTENKSEAPSIETPPTPAVAPQPVQSQRVDPPAAPEQGHTEARPA
jgi:sec-independent protein translocase protein TatA